MGQQSNQIEILKQENLKLKELIKELEQENLILTQQNKSLINQEEYISQKMKQIGFDNIEDLCKSQKQLAISELEKLKENAYQSATDISCLLDYTELVKIINDQIKSLKGEE